MKKGLKLKEEKINTLSETIKNYETKEIEFQKDLNNKNKKLEDMENENK